MYDSLFEQCENKKVSGQSADKELVYIKLIALKYYIYSLTIPREQKKDLFLIASLFNQISNTIVAIVKLADMGLDYQAFALMRNLIELYMLLLTVIESPQKRREYGDAVDAKTAREVWHRFFNKAHFIQTLVKYLDDNSEGQDLCKRWVDNIYSDLSSYAHNDYVNIVCYNYAIGENDVNPLNLWGEYVTRKKNVYQCLVNSIAPSEILLNKMLSDDSIDISIRDFFDEIKCSATLETRELHDIILCICKNILIDCINDNRTS